MAGGLAAVDSILEERPRLVTPELLQARYEVGGAARVAGRVRVPVHAVCDGRRAAAAAMVTEVVSTNGGWAFTNFVHGLPAGDLLDILYELRP